MIRTCLFMTIICLSIGCIGTVTGQVNRSSSLSEDLFNDANRSAFHGTPRKGAKINLPDRKTARKVDHSSPNILTVPHWSDSFVYQQLEYKYTMVGTNPKNNPGTTVIPTTLVPLRFIFADGSVYDASVDNVEGQTPVQGFINSPVFQNHSYVIGGTDVGNTQFGDAFQRANFWSDVSKGSHDYHVLLGTPQVATVQTINVPAGKFDYQTDPDTHQIFPVVDLDYLDQKIRALLQTLNGSPASLQVFVTGRVAEFYAWGYHDSFYDGHTDRTYIVAPYLSSNAVFYGQHVPDTYTLSHEVLEWMNDPFQDEPNFVPGWMFAGNAFEQCDSTPTADLLEVGDPFAFSDASVITVFIGTSPYHVTDAGFLSYFTRTGNSRSVNGQYSFFGSATQPTPPCIGHLEINFSTFEFPGARLTIAFGINNRGQIVGEYRDARNKAHGFLLDQGQFTSLDFPGAVGTFPQKISDSGQVVGYYVDSANLPHGFSYQSGRFLAINYPGAVDTIASGVNSAGEIVGGYDDSQLQTHSFVFNNGSFVSFDSPFAAQSQAAAINDEKTIVGLTWNLATDPLTSFIVGKTASAFTMPGSVQTLTSSINNHNDLAGHFFNNSSTSGFITLYGYIYQVYPYANGNNDKNQVVGRVFDPSAGRFVGYVANLPSRNE